MDTLGVLAKTGAVAGLFVLTVRLLLQWDEERQVRIASRVLNQVQKQLEREADSKARSNPCSVQSAAQRRTHAAGSAEIAEALILHAPGDGPSDKATSMRCCRFECNESSFRSSSSRQTMLLHGPPRSKSASSYRCPSDTSHLGVSFGSVSLCSDSLQRQPSSVLPSAECNKGIQQTSWDCQLACLVFGSITMDLHAVVDGLVRKSDLLRLSALGRFTASPGGKAANEAVGLCKLGVRTHLVARVGFDAMGVSLLKELSKVQAQHPSLDISGVTTAESDVATGVSVQILAHAAEEQRPCVVGSESSHRSTQAAAEPSLRRASTGSCPREQSGAARGALPVEERLSDSVPFLSKVIASGANEDVSVCGDEVAYALSLLRGEAAKEASEASATSVWLESSGDGCGESDGGDACKQPAQPKVEVGVLLLQLEVSTEPMRVLAAAAREQGKLVALKASPLGPGRTLDKARLLLGGDGEADGLIDLLFIGGVEAALLLESDEELLTTSDAAAAAEAIMSTWRSLRAVVVLCDSAHVLLTRSAALSTRHAAPDDRLSAANTARAAECSECDVDNTRANAGANLPDGGERSVKPHEKEKKLLFCLPCTRRKLVDSLGFKDAFVSGFVGGHCIGLSLREALLWGYGSSVLSLSAPGAQAGLPSRDELVAFLTENLPLLPWRMHSATHASLTPPAHASPNPQPAESATRDSTGARHADGAGAASPCAGSSSSDFLAQTYWHQAVCRADVACVLVMACMHPRGLGLALGQRDAFGVTPFERAYACWHQTGRHARYGAVLRMLAASHILLHTLRTCSMFKGSYEAEHGLCALARHTDVVERLLPGLDVGLCLEPSASRAQVVGLGVDLFSSLLLCNCAAEERAAINSLLLHYLDACEAHCCHLNALRSAVTARSEAKLHAAAVSPAEERAPLAALRRSDTDDGIFKTPARLPTHSILSVQRSSGRSTSTCLRRGNFAALRNGSPVRTCIFLDALLCYRTADGHTLLMHAVIAGATRLVERLVRLCRSRVQYRHTLHARTSTCGSSALHFATQSGNLHTCRALIKGGLNIYYKRFDGQSALECCAPHIADTIKALHTSGRSFAAFLSHAKKDAAATARTLKDYLQAELQREVFLDCDNLHRLSELQNNVRDTEVFVQLQTRHVLERPYCLLELLTAIDAGVPIVLVEVASNSDEYTFDHEEASAFLADLENTLKPWAWNELLRWRPADRRETAELLYSTIVHTVSRKIDFGAPKRVLNAMLRELAETIRASAAGFEHESEETNMSTPLGGRNHASPPMIKRDMTY